MICPTCQRWFFREHALRVYCSPECQVRAHKPYSAAERQRQDTEAKALCNALKRQAVATFRAEKKAGLWPILPIPKHGPGKGHQQREAEGPCYRGPYQKNVKRTRAAFKVGN